MTDATRTFPPADRDHRPAKKSFTRFIPTAARILMGLIFFVFGLNGFLNFIPPPSQAMPDRATAFITGMMKTGYLFQLLKGTEVTVGMLLLINRFVPLALVLIAPIVVNIFCFHAFILPSGLPVAIIVLALEIYLAWSYRNAYRLMFTPRAVPG
jgi:uncharacterized membrane protein YphA (DoxX/SURF4 family)